MSITTTGQWLLKFVYILFDIASIPFFLEKNPQKEDFA